MTRHDPAAPVQSGELFAGKYVIDRVIGTGSMGVVVVASHAQLHEKVVLKFLRYDVAQRADVVARFLREARSAVRIRNEHVARIIDVGATDDGLPYIVMEHLEGCDLQELLRNRRTIAIGEAVDYVAQACLAMVEAHAAGVVHRDLKPSNIFLTRRADGSSLVKVLDFGISKVLADSSDQTDITATNGILGSPIYISPEQARSARSVDARADVWSLGVILHHLLTGRPPFMGDSITEVLSAILFAPPTRLREGLPDAPPELEAAILKCLTKEVDQRMPSAAKLAEALAPWAEPESRLAIARISSAPPPVVEATGPIPPATAHAEAPGRTMTGWAAGGRGLRSPGLAKVVGGCAVLATVAGTSTYFIRHRPIARAVAPAVRASTSVDTSAPSESRPEPSPSESGTHRPEFAPPRPPDIARSTAADVAPAGLVAPESAPPALASAAGVRSSAAEAAGLGHSSKPPRVATPRSAASASVTVANRAPPAATSSAPAIDPGTLTFDLGGKPQNGQPGR